MHSLRSHLQRATAAKPKQLLVLKEYDKTEVTEAIEGLAGATGRPLLRFDLSTVVSKYIGETEKALQAILEGARDSGAILFFDEANALFGKRTGVKDAHDRYANRKADYLLQKMEDYNGLVVVALTCKSNRDKPFLHRWKAPASK